MSKIGNNLYDIAKKMFEIDSDINSFPTFLAGYNFGRGLFTNKKDSPHIVTSNEVLVWKVIEDRLLQKDNIRILFNGENYVIEWHFEYVLKAGGDIYREIFFFHWKGMNAVKGFSPLPSNVDLENVIVERIYQWGEPPVFFHIFPHKLIVLSGKEEEFKPSRPHLLMLNGEIINELHLFEIPCSWKSFRSHAILFIIVPYKSTIFIWYGDCVHSSVIKMVKSCQNLYTNIKNVHKSWSDFKFIDVHEGHDEVLEDLWEEEEGSREYVSIKNKNAMFTPRMFFLVFTDDGVNPVEIKNSLRAPNIASSFPFVQTHLCSAPQPAIFLLDNHNEIWLWKGILKPDNDAEKYNKHSKMAEELLNEYVKIKGLMGIDCIVSQTTSGHEPIEFTNIFPYWKY